MTDMLAMQGDAAPADTSLPLENLAPEGCFRSRCVARGLRASGPSAELVQAVRDLAGYPAHRHPGKAIPMAMGVEGENFIDLMVSSQTGSKDRRLPAAVLHTAAPAEPRPREQRARIRARRS